MVNQQKIEEPDPVKKESEDEYHPRNVISGGALKDIQKFLSKNARLQKENIKYEINDE